MPIDFPIPTFVGETFSAGGKTWIWNGYAWDAATITAVGATGATGVQGATGIGATGEVGPQGATGVVGATGVTGATGDTGSTGATGIEGATGIQGATGDIGSTGATGVQGATGEIGATGASGVEGDRYHTTSNTVLDIVSTGTITLTTDDLNLDYSIEQSVIVAYSAGQHMHGRVSSYNPGTGVLVLNVTDSAGSGTGLSPWQVNLDGAVGVQGATGATGVQGATGADGATGATGDHGATGAQGATGEVGSTGATGVIGATGSIGATGEVGPQGSTGPIGATGVAGATGDQGSTGATGPIGATGIGSPGSAGATGATGLTGATGAAAVISQVTGVYYVAKNGSDSNTGTVAAPFLTIQNAINQVPTGTDDYTIYVASGIYDENLTINRINIHIVGMTDDALQNKAVLIRGTTSITATGTGSLFNNTIVLNNLTLANTFTAGYTVSSTGSGYTFTIKNTVIEQDNAGFGAVNIANTTNDTRTYFDNAFVIANPAGRNALDFSGGTIFEIKDSIFYANGVGGLAINATSSNAWINSARNSTFQSLGKTISLSTNNQSTANLSSFLNCTINGLPASSTTGIVSLGGGTQAAFSFTRCNITNLATNASSDFPFFEFNTAAILFSVGNIFVSLKASAVNFRPVYAVTTASPNAVFKYLGNTFASNKTSGTDTFLIPTAGLNGWAIVERLIGDYIGATGATGAAGATGLTGATGVAGATGLTGSTGIQGATGTIGSTGATGATGVGSAGATGATGATGLNGATGLGYQGVTSSNSIQISSTGTATFTVNKTDAFVVGNRVRVINSSTNYFEGTITSIAGNNWQVARDFSIGSGILTPWTISLVGARGETGATGATGLTGATGIQGATGETGATGIGDVTLTGIQTLTNKTIEAGTFTNGYTEEVLSTTISASTYTIDLVNGSIQYFTLGNASITFTFPTSTTGRSMMIVLKQDAVGSRAVTWPTSVKWAGASTPTLTSTASRSDVFSFTCIDGSSWIGVVVGQNYTI